MKRLEKARKRQAGAMGWRVGGWAGLGGLGGR